MIPRSFGRPRTEVTSLCFTDSATDIFFAEGRTVNKSVISRPNHVAVARVLFAVLFATFAALCQADVTTYECVILEEKELSEQGRLANPQFARDVGRRFYVDRATGIVLGAGFMTPLARAKATVVDAGSREEGFKVVYIEDKGASGKGVEVLKIQEWASGRTKPFVAMGWRSIVSGTCE